ncbi:MAG: TRAP transporter substrate-binding protein [Deltaproteobacteria bacterium]|nr:TRAP transporter substrate-binding protein [Deltaproteobacteria bacterium]
MKEKKSFSVLSIVFCLVFLLTIFSFTFAQAQSKVYRLRASSPFPSAESSQKYLLIPIAKEIEKVTDGRVKITVHTSGALGKAQDHFDMASSGIADIALSVQAYTAGRFPLSSVVELPFLANTAECGSRILWALYEKFPEFRAEYKDVKVLGLHFYGANQLLSAKKPIRNLDDMKGLKIRGTGEVQGEMIKLMGAVPLSMPAPQIYESLDKGVIDGVLFAYGAQRGFKFYEVIKYATTADLFVGPMFLVMNLKKWNSLPPDIQRKIDKITGFKAAIQGGTGYDSEDKLGIQDCLKAGVDIYQLPPKELEKWKTLCKPLWDKWVKKMEAKGLPGRKILKEAESIAAIYNK